MSWIKKIFTIFQNEDEEMNHNDRDLYQEKPLPHEPKGTKDVEAKVLYQYPKGQFRFPLIPDSEKTAGAKREKGSRPSSMKAVTEVKPLIKEQGPLRFKENLESAKEAPQRIRHESGNEASPKLRRERGKAVPSGFRTDSLKESSVKEANESAEETGHKFRYQPGNEAAEKIRQGKGMETSPKFRQPFKPTEIPSPIYAYNRPKRMPKKTSETEQIEYELTGFEREQIEKEKRLNSAGHNLTQENEAFEKSEKGLKENMESTQQAGEASRDVEEEPQQAREASRDVEEGNRRAAESTQQAGEATNGAVEEPQKAAEGTRQACEQELITRDHPAVISLPEESGDESVVENESGQAGAAERPAEPIKRVLPFNVIMLKQDKKKWEERKVLDSLQIRSDRKVDYHSSDAMGEGLAVKNSHEQAEQRERNSHAGALQSIPGDTKGESATLHSAAGEIIQNSAADGASHGQASQQGHAEIVAAENVPLAQGEIQAAENVPLAQGEIQAVGDYAFPPLDLLNPPVFKAPDPQWLAEQEHMLNETLKNFNVGARVVNMTQGPSVTRFEVQPEPGVKVNKITNLSDDIKLSLAAKDIRIEAPIPGKHTIGIEVPNHSSRPVLLSEILQSGDFLDQESPLSVALGLDIAGNPIVTDLKKMPHGLIAGATGSGKSVCINTMLVSLLYKAHPDDVKLLLIDPKMVELAPYNQIPHLVSPVITDVKAATASLKWAVEEMERRYELFAHTGVRDISRFNELAIKHRRFSDKLPYIVIVIDELADLMMMAPADVEEAICRIAQKARACGIHLIIATQRPSVDVITGLIKANVPTRIAFSVSSQIDSRTIIDISGAEKLLGRGDMLFLENGSSKPFRLQGTFVTDSEIDDIVAFVREQRAPQYLFEQEELLKKAQISEGEDELFYEACEFVVEQGGASTSSVQRRFKIGYNRAARLIEMMEQQGFISEGRGSKPRDVLISAADLDSIQETSTFN